MPARSSFDYAVIRIVPRVEREEFLNAGVILFCLNQRFLQARTALDEARLRALWPQADVGLVQAHLAAIPRVCAGGREAGPLGALPQKERWHWLTAPRSTILQTSPVHSGLTLDPARTLDLLMKQMVEPPGR